jgi:LAS superfamily LD-carboxypeptidase LdcB
VTPAQLTGRAATHIVELPELECAVHASVVAPFLGLRRAALTEGFDLIAVSSFRDFDRQLAIWNGKFGGERPLLDREGRALAVAELSPEERVAAILLWSALPGASRHHWGTDLDFVDRSVLAGHRLQLTVEEFAPGGVFAAFSTWLQSAAPRFGFFRPYRGSRSGVQREDWHYSFAPLAETARRALNPAVLKAALVDAPLAGKEVVFGQLDALHERYVKSIDLP